MNDPNVECPGDEHPALVLNCASCAEDLPVGKSMAEWSNSSCGVSADGQRFIVWCMRHKRAILDCPISELQHLLVHAHSGGCQKCSPTDEDLEFTEEKPWERDNDLTYRLLSLTGEGCLVPMEAIEKWTDTQCMEAEQWAGATHLHASDNDDIQVPTIPAHVKEWDTPGRRTEFEKQMDDAILKACNGPGNKANAPS